MARRRVAIISTAGLNERGGRPFALGETGYRLIRGDLDMADMVMSHVSTNFDRSGFQQDVNVIFPIDRLRELAAEGDIDSVADYHYSFMGATDPEQMAPTIEHLAPLLKKDRVDAVLLAPVCLLCTRAVGGLAHHLEAAGIATTQISLIRLHTEQVRPPRALWVPFDLGRPFGTPNDAPFQTRVVMSALRLLEADSGPVLKDFPDDEPVTAGEQTGWACPINFTRPTAELSGAAAVETALKNEIAQFAPWYDVAVKARGRTTVGASGLELDEIAALFAAMFEDPLPASPSADVPLADMLRLSAEDLKAYFVEAASAQPGDAGNRQLANWFWSETFCANTLKRLKERCIASDDDALKIVGNLLLVPAAQAD